ncbi:MAG: nicotinate (nicotinamide) nucleotide adenylyltransferase [Hyphomicrobiales bacterium]|jgi:nicotinate-nucleotide adenylyltransferase|nr:nicotinate (nicotinamide) nucleotide adenylyltransferase [Hyphomicrobiales bacterium]
MISKPKIKRWIIGKTNFASSNQRIGILGGSFNPSHDGHIKISEAALKKLNLDIIWWVVSPRNPLKKYDVLFDFKKRTSSAKNKLKTSKIIINDIEQRTGTIYTIGTIEYLKKKYPNTKFIWIMGADNLRYFHLWMEWEKIIKEIPIAIIDRPSSSLDVSSTIFANKYKKYRIDENDASYIINSKKPCWIFLHNKLNFNSSTEIRKKLKIYNQNDR